VHLVYMDEKIEQYIVDIVAASRNPEEYELVDIKDLIAYGGSPRASLYLKLGSKANAFLRGRGYVIPDDVRDIGYDVLRHRLILTYEAQAEDITPEDVIEKIFSGVEVP
jgi:MoxR-like ATPase